MSKYTPLITHLKSLDTNDIPMTFSEIEAVINSSLPPSARKHRPWWSNNPSNSVMTQSWLAAGYKVTKVDLAREQLVFVKQGLESTLLHRTTAGSQQSLSKTHPVFGCMRNTVVITDEADLIGPAMPEWAELLQNMKILNE